MSDFFNGWPEDGEPVKTGMRDLNCGRWPQINYCPTCKRYDFHSGACADQNALLDYKYGKHPIPYPPRKK